MTGGDFSRSVFINCPFTPDYREFLRAILFVVLRLGFEPRLASEESDSGDPRIEKIKRLIRECRHSIHDLSLNVAARKGETARMNMPYELGIDLGSRWFGPSPLNQKVTLILEKDRGSVKKALTDLAGMDPRSYGGSIDNLIREIRAHFLAFLSKESTLPPDFPTHDSLWDDWVSFLPWLQQRPDGGLRSARELEDMESSEFREKIREWLSANRSADGSPRSPAYELIRKEVSDAFDLAIRAGVSPWATMGSQKGMEIVLPDGRKIAYSGVEFSGSSRHTFWNEVPKALIKDLSRCCFEWTRKLCKSKNINPVLPLRETAMFLHGGLERFLNQMVEIDRKLRGKGFPRSVQPYQPEKERKACERLISSRLKAELNLEGATPD